ncbi:MAG: ATP-dependent sacrificial sulfur transferase LarE [Kofleriaceae bacterium]|nr:ATP-dependent sacrificial sulfur transferase LarE [Kofleriaceae bacterium]
MAEPLIDDKYRALLVRLRELAGQDRALLIAFSGGVDSAFLLRAAIDAVADRAYAVTAVSETMARSEIADAQALGVELGLGARHFVVESHELQRPGFAHNPTNRCALCKTELMSVALPLAEKLGGAVIALGTNVDDLGDFRPGIAAAADGGAVTPMVDVGLRKTEIRELSQQLGLRTWNKPQLACLSSRFPHGTEITIDRLRRVDEFEDGLRQLGFGQLRVRFHDQIARVELPTDDIARACAPTLRTAISNLGKRLGFTFVTVDLDGFRSGSLNPPLLQLGRRIHERS